MPNLPTFLRFAITDDKGRISNLRWRIPDQPEFPVISTDINAFLAVLNGAGLPSLGGLASVFVEQNLIALPGPAQPGSDVRDKWTTRFLGADGHLFRVSIPAANPDNKFIATGGVVLANLSQSDIAALITAWQATTIRPINPITASSGTVTQMVSVERNRVRPRVGSTK